jgi:hypothetical protein
MRNGMSGLRICLTCGHSTYRSHSANQHATTHIARHHMAIIHSLEPTDDWSSCYVGTVASSSMTLRPTIPRPLP